MNAQAGGGVAPAPAGPATPGELLRQERERRALSVQQAAEDLHLDVWMIEAIEANRFVALGAPVYAKGHLRKYATLLGLSPAFVIERYEALSDTPVVPTPIPATVAAPVRRERRSLKGPLWIIAGMLALAAGWWAFDRYTGHPADVAVDALVSSVTPPDEAPGPVPSALAEPAADSLVEPAPAASEPIVTATPAIDTSSGSSAGAAQIRLSMAFSESCWTEVYDATGRQLMFDLGARGGVRTVSGVPPLHVTFGLASAVTAQVDDRPIVVPRRAGRDAARFVVAADGTVSPE